jgi:DNA-binding response OmpR family regulator
MQQQDPRTIMVLEPDVIVRSEVSEFLRQCGFDVIEGVAADDLRAALAAGARIDVLLAEIQLKGKGSGFELAQEVRQTRPGIAVILVSSVDNVVEKATDLCGRGPVKKPYRSEEILRRIRVLTGLRDRMDKAAGKKE